MSELNLVNGAILGIVQGVAEFLPISSSAHLAQAQRQFGLTPDTTEMLLFDVLVHLATLLAVAIVFAKPAALLMRRLQRESSSDYLGRRHGWRIVLLTVIATIPTAIIGLRFQSTFEKAFNKPIWIGWALIFTGAMLATMARIKRGRRGWQEFAWWQAAAVGVAQSAAIMPGLSRSGATICVATYCGLRRRWAAHFSFLIAVPAILGATMIKLLEVSHMSSAQLQEVNWLAILSGSATALLTGIVALQLLLSAVRRAKLHYFAVYCWIVGVATLLA